MTKAIAVICLIVLVACFGWVYARLNAINSRLALLTNAVVTKNDRLQIRSLVIKRQLSQAQNPVVFIGDSITENALLPPQILGSPVVNAGVSGATVETYLAMIDGDNLLNGLNASLIVVALGTNNANKLSSLSGFESCYRTLVSELKNKSANIVLVGVPDIGSGSAAPIFDTSELPEINNSIRRISTDLGLKFVEPAKYDTVDGVHLSADGYKIWLKNILSDLAS